MKKHIFLSILVSILSFQLNSQIIKTEWIQEFESKMKIENILLIENECIYIHTSKLNTVTFERKHVIQKRKISNNSLVKEIEIDVFFHGDEQMAFEEDNSVPIIKIKSDLYLFTKYMSKKEKKGYIHFYKLNKTNLAFEEVKQFTIEIPQKNPEFFISYEPVTLKSEETILLTATTATTNFEIINSQDFIVTVTDFKKLSKSESDSIYTNLENNKFIIPCKEAITKEEYGFMRPKIICNNRTYFECLSIHNLGETRKDNYYSLCIDNNNPKDENKIFLLNYCSNIDSLISGLPMSEISNYKLLQKMDQEKNINNCKNYSDFSFSVDKYDDISHFRSGNYNYFVKIDNTKEPYNSDRDVKYVPHDEIIYISHSKDIEIACVSNDGIFQWKKEIIREEYNENDQYRSYYQIEYKDKIILFYANKYLIIDSKTGENRIETIPDFDLGKNAEFKLFENKIVVISYVDNDIRKIGIVEITE